MRDLAEIVAFWTGDGAPSRDGVRLIVARSILTVKAALRDTFPAGLVVDPVVDIMMSLFVGGATAGPMSHAAACAVSGVQPAVAKRWLMELAQQGLIVVTTGAGGQSVSLSDAGFAQVTRAIDVVLERQAALLG